MKENIKVTIYPEYNSSGGNCIFVEMPEDSIMTLVEMLRNGSTVRYSTQKTIGPNKGNWMTVKIVRAD